MIFRGVPPSSSLLGWLKYRSSIPFLLSELRNGDQGGTHASNLTSGPLRRRRRSRVICSQFTSRPSLPPSLPPSLLGQPSETGGPRRRPRTTTTMGLRRTKSRAYFRLIEIASRYSTDATERGGRDPSLDRFPITPSAEIEGGECRVRNPW